MSKKKTNNGSKPKKSPLIKTEDKPTPASELLDEMEKEESVEKKAPKKKVKKKTVPKNEDIIERTKRILNEGPKTMFMCPPAPGDKEGAVETVSINGYSLTIKKGVMVEIPTPFAEILAEHYRVELSAGKEMLIDRDSKKEDALL